AGCGGPGEARGAGGWGPGGDALGDADGRDPGAIIGHREDVGTQCGQGDRARATGAGDDDCRAARSPEGAASAPGAPDAPEASGATEASQAPDATEAKGATDPRAGRCRRGEELQLSRDAVEAAGGDGRHLTRQAASGAELIADHGNAGDIRADAANLSGGRLGLTEGGLRRDRLLGRAFRRAFWRPLGWRLRPRHDRRDVGGGAM